MKEARRIKDQSMGYQKVKAQLLGHSLLPHIFLKMRKERPIIVPSS
jgi:hypothetical protein